MIKVGDKAPDFLLDSTLGKKLGLKNYKGRNVLVAFYCFCFSPVCTTEFQDFKANFNKFKKSKVHILGVSTDSTWTQRAWSRLLKLPFPLVSDFHKSVTKKYGVLSKRGMPERSYFLVDKKGVVRYIYVEKTPLQCRPSVHILEELKKSL